MIHVCTNCKKELTYAGLCVDCQREYEDYCEYIRENDEQYVTVTKEMAIDAGDKNLEGQVIKWS